jgi:hypothetical protein
LIQVTIFVNDKSHPRKENTENGPKGMNDERMNTHIESCNFGRVIHNPLSVKFVTILAEN